MISMIILEVLGIIEVVWRELVAKVAKEANLGKISQGVPVHVQGCTGTPHQKQTCTGTCVPKMPRMLCFCVIKPEFVHR